jgi:hypothetical protein
VDHIEAAAEAWRTLSPIATAFEHVAEEGTL